MWIGNGITGGRDQADALSQLIQQDFSVSSEIPVKLQLVSSSQLMTPSTLLSATATGTGPDVALQLQGSEPVNYAMRNALVNLRDFDDFETVISRFSKEAIIPYSYNGGVYALPETVSFPMLFYRKDILLSLGIDIESIQTWQDLIALLPILQVKHMNMALPANNYTYTMLLYQKNESLYKDNFEKTNLNSKAALDSFDTLMKFYTDYNLPFSYNFVTRFRTGEIPIGIDDYTSYNLLKISAPEIAGQWGMRTVPGTADTNGSINNSVPISGNSFGCAMMAASKGKKSAWEFMKWWADSNTQIKFGEELESVMGIGARYNTANMEALQKLPWQVQEKTALMTQMESLKGIPEVPGGYQTARNIEFAMNTVYNTGKDPRKVLLSYVDQINREISIKRSEFGLSQGGK